MIVVAVFQIVTRQLLGSMFAMPWADELVRFIVLWLAMVGSIAATASVPLNGQGLLAGLVATGEVRPVLDYSFPLDEAADAIRYSETGRARGKILIRVK